MVSNGGPVDDDALLHELRTQVAYWQKVLYLQDWTIEVRLLRQWEMSDRQTLAQCEWYLQRKDAILGFLSPQDIVGLHNRFLNDEEADYDISLVHELLHLHFAPFHKEDDELFHEQAINAISRGMVKVWRESHKGVELIIPPVTSEGYL